MDPEVVRCPYRVLDDEFTAMLQRPEWFVCEQCGHVVLRQDPGFRCSAVGAWNCERRDFTAAFPKTRLPNIIRRRGVARFCSSEAGPFAFRYFQA